MVDDDNKNYFRVFVIRINNGSKKMCPALLIWLVKQSKKESIDCDQELLKSTLEVKRRHLFIKIQRKE